MPYVTRLLLILTSHAAIKTEIRQQIEQLWKDHVEALEQVVLEFVRAEISPATMFDFETRIAERVRELARQLVENVLNLIEADDAEKMPHDLEHQGGSYRRLNQKTRNAHVGTLFGTIELWRYSYRYWHRDVAETCIFPLEIELGLVHGATPALAEAVGRYMAQSGATQQAVLDRLRLQHGVSWGAQRLRDVTEELSLAFEDVGSSGDTIPNSCNVARNLVLCHRNYHAGEDEELSVMRFLWDLCDGPNPDEPWDRVQMAVADLVSDLSQLRGRYDEVTLSSLVHDLSRNASQQKIFDYGALLQEENDAPVPRALCDRMGNVKTTWTAADQAPTIIWEIPQGNAANFWGTGCAAVGNLFDQFLICFWDANNNLIASIAITSLSQAGVTCRADHSVAYNLPQDLWLNTIALVPGVKHWSVSGRWNCAADAYWYSSDSATFTVT